MQLDDRPESDQVEDDRGGGGGGGGGGRGVVVGGIGTLILAVVIGLITGRNPLQILQLLSSSGAPSSPARSASPTDRAAGETSSTSGNSAAPEDEGKRFVRIVLADTEDTWTKVFREHAREYRLPKLVLFDDEIASGCGESSSAVGPFYCPEDSKVYLDLSFFRELSQRFGAPGDFARAYVIAHEVGHHVQNLLGIFRAAGNDRRASIALELQADCLAGVWGNRGDKKGLLSPGDVEQGLRAAAAVGDDALQKMATGRVQPETWTHGSSSDRVLWLKRGLESGDPEVCRTFGTPLFR